MSRNSAELVGRASAWLKPAADFNRPLAALASSLSAKGAPRCSLPTKFFRSAADVPAILDQIWIPHGAVILDGRFRAATVMERPLEFVADGR